MQRHKSLAEGSPQSTPRSPWGGTLAIFDPDGQGSNFTDRFRMNANRPESVLGDTAAQQAAVKRRRSKLLQIDHHTGGKLEGEPLWRSVFQKVQDDGQVHHDDLLSALELSGFHCPDQEWVDDVYYRITQYSAIGADDFVALVRLYALRQKQAFIEAFRRADTDGSNELERHELRDLLKGLGIEPMRHVLDEVFAETDADGKGTLDVIEFEAVMDLIRGREGFTKREYDEFTYVYKKFDFDRSDEIDTQELTAILGWLGYACDLKEAKDILAEVDVDHSGTLNPREYLMCMRKVREREIEKISRCIRLSDADGNGTVSQDEMYNIACMLGYWPDVVALHEAGISAGIEDLEAMDLSSVWQQLTVYRSREGFSFAEAKEIQEAFEKFDTHSKGEIHTRDVGKLLRWLGYALPIDVAQLAVAKVDVNNSGLLDLPELRKMMRIYHEKERQHIATMFKGRDVHDSGTLNERDAAAVLQELCETMEACGILPGMISGILTQELDQARRSTDRSVDLRELLAIFQIAKNSARQQFRDCMGFSPKEVLELKEKFKTYESGGLGRIGHKDLIRLLRDTFPNMAHTKTMRPIFESIIAQADNNGDGCLAIEEYLKFMRLLQEVQDDEKYDKLNTVVQQAKFSPPEVEGFRELFLGKDLDGLAARCDGMTFEDVKDLISAIVPLGHRWCCELEEYFREVERKRTVFEAVLTQRGVLDFPDFLLLMRKVMDVNFGRINDTAGAQIQKQGLDIWQYEAKRQSLQAAHPGGTDWVPRTTRKMRKSTTSFSAFFVKGKE
jgi:Ca2+-binding EF-hand superfamily protein